MGDRDTRWIHRGAYDLMNANPAATASPAGLPRALALYGSLPEQLARPDSFASQLRAMLAIRQEYGIYAARQIDVPDVTSPGLLVMVHELPEGRGVQVTAINFGATPVDEVVRLAGVGAGLAMDMFRNQVEGSVSAAGELRVRLAEQTGASYLIAR
jgi:trehalose synthase